MESMEEIYQNHSKKVYTFLLSKTCNHELAEELTQETFFCAVNSINKFKGNQRIIAGNVQFKGIAAGRGVGFTTGLLLLRKGLGMQETPIRPHSWH